jgi:Homeodomain-like domain/Integrase core domain
MKPDTIMGWYRKLVARKFDGSKSRRYPGRPKIDHDIELLIVRIAKENSGWGYDRIVGAMANLGYTVSDQTVGNILQRSGIPPAPERKRTTTWADFIRAGMTPHPNEAWMKKIARNVTMDEWGFLGNCRYLIHDRDTKYCQSFRDIIESGDVKPLRLPARSPNLNAFSERWVKSVKNECLSKLILFGEASLRRALREYLAHYHAERNHQGKDNILLFPTAGKVRNHGSGAIDCNKRLGGLLKYYHLEAARVF